ncbi:hypothetical protein [Streptomyces sp. NPDC002666]
MAFPQDRNPIRIEAAFGADVNGPESAWQWTAVTGDLLDQTITIQGGQANEASTLTPTSLSLELDNPHGNYTPDNPMSTHYPNVVMGTPCRASFDGGEPYLRLDGTTAGAATTPDTAALDITGDIDIRVEATADWYATAVQTLVGKWVSAVGRRSYMLRLENGLLTLNWSPDGTNLYFAQQVLPALPRRAALRATLDVDNGAGGLTYTAYWAESLAGPWMQIADPVGAALTTSIYAGTAPLEIAPTAVIGWSPMRGRVHRAEVRNGINGTVVASPDFTTQTPDTTGFTDAAGRVWSVTGAAEVSIRQYRFTGNIAEWLPTWPYGDLSDDERDQPGESRVAITAAGILRRLGQPQKTLASTLRRRIPSATALLAYWPMEEDQNAGTQAFSPVEGVRPLTLTGADWASNSDLGGSSPLPTLKNPASLTAQVPSTTTVGWQVEFVYNLPVLPAAQTEIMRVSVTGATMRTAILYASTAGIRIEARDKDDAVLAFYLNNNAPSMAAFVGGWNRVAIYTGNAGGGVTLLSVTWRDVSSNIRYFAETVPVTGQGRVASLSGSWGAAAEGMSLGHLTVTATPGTGVSGQLPVSTIFEGADDGFAGETAGVRLMRLCNEEGVPMQLLGPPADTAAMGAQRPGKLLDLLTECAATDMGILGEQRERSGLQYRPRTTLYNQPVRMTFDANHDEITNPFAPALNDQGIRNESQVSRPGGSAAVVTNDASIAAAGQYAEQITVNAARDDQLPGIAGWRVHLGTWPGMRYPSLASELAIAPQLIDSWMGTESGDRMQVINLPPQHPPGPVDVLAQGYTETLTPTRWTLALNCVAAGPWQVAVEGDPVYARADTSGCVTAGAITATDTAMDVVTTVGRQWATSTVYPDEFPFDVTAGGEQMTVTALTQSGYDTFGRTVASGWGTAESGQAWARDGGVAADYSVSGGVGKIVSADASTFHISTVPVQGADVDMQVDFNDSPMPTSGSNYAFLMCRYSDPTHFYMARVQRTTAGGVILTLRKRNGAESQLGSAYTYAGAFGPSSWFTVRLAVIGSQLSAKVWLRGTTEPSDWQLTATDTDLTAAGEVGFRSLSSGLPLPVTFSVDNVVVLNQQRMTVTRSVNGIVKPQTGGTDVRLTYPPIAAL